MWESTIFSCLPWFPAFQMVYFLIDLTLYQFKVTYNNCQYTSTVCLCQVIVGNFSIFFLMIFHLFLGTPNKPFRAHFIFLTKSSLKCLSRCCLHGFVQQIDISLFTILKAGTVYTTSIDYISIYCFYTGFAAAFITVILCVSGGSKLIIGFQHNSGNLTCKLTDIFENFLLQLLELISAFLLQWYSSYSLLYVFFFAVNIIKKNCMIGKRFRFLPFIFAN